ncbi:MAG TPA: SRPBCC family protein [Amycolatopsis sp.]|uniref:SRPBCC family protein n=1 Tax=Amycolatopsis sp. TaxID=37632 RepID=UPI002B467714|nr:SRPBCC family protein [Amycolatopsis sp.]HKS49760.1 SRPBCC family protein [Amycolatopsis sp.]
MVAKQAQKVAGAVQQKAEEVAPDLAGKVTEKLPDLTPSNQLNESLRKLAGTLTTRAATSLAGKLTSATGRLTEYAESGGVGGLVKAITGDEGGSKIKRKAILGALKGGFSGATEGITEGLKGLFGGKGGGKGKVKMTNIVETVDIGLPIDLVYDQWTRFTDFPSFMKKVEDVGQISDETVRWTAKIFWSRRTWEATILDQVPDDHIVWRSKADKGHVDGSVTFHEMSPNMTRVAVVLEYYPKGFFEHTGNLWRAQGRRARLELKHFRRHMMVHAILQPDEIEGWRGEIHDAKVVSRGEEEPEEEFEGEYEEEVPEPRREREPAQAGAREGESR